MIESSFFSADAVTIADTTSLEPGSLAFILRNKHLALFGAFETRRQMLDLGGKEAFTIWKDFRGLGSCVLVKDWRLEVDVQTATSPRAGFTPGHAFVREGGIFGVIGLTKGQHFRDPLGITVTGATDRLDEYGLIALFSQWRLVAGSTDRPSVLCASDAAASAKASLLRGA